MGPITNIDKMISSNSASGENEKVKETGIPQITEVSAPHFDLCNMFHLSRNLSMRDIYLRSETK